MPLKMFLAAALLAAVLIGLMLPTPHGGPQAQAQSQLSAMEIGPG